MPLALTWLGNAQDEKDNSKDEIKETSRNDAYMNSNFGSSIRGEKAVVEEEQSKLSEKRNEVNSTPPCSKYGDLYDRCPSEVVLDVDAHSLPSSQR